MPRKPIPPDTQKNVLLKSRRRCCLCFWLDGCDENTKGQIAHLDQNNANCDEDNLAFLCLEHHDEYDGKTSVSKGLRRDEIRHWRDELYKEMEHRFRISKRRGFDLIVLGFLYTGVEDVITARFRLTNTGEISVRSPVVTIRLPTGIKGDAPRKPLFRGFAASIPNFEPYAMHESQQDVFEPNGRVAIKELGGPNPILMPGHSFTFEGLNLHFRHYGPATELELEYRVDAEDVAPVGGKIVAKVPARGEELLKNENDE